ncbi:NADPH-dependent assimilatory sulfite reductase hemoprotein subunit [Leucothrix pacifica]|uniref:assimilatory sulfite reductase (NADPH) n=1 Tax=Leucothrix pacifica TaxID=1247513 RepID=A0A317C6U6_9GAMM|nr:NADPH-dependent assimilatory sulfite reductase hemoprotein subunit [Leucothrix pacifica]PWQ94356.1 NADPH-dependent assimilatory sulfite reductase hemoprotein subunit [Leucothrix pacifica]
MTFATPTKKTPGVVAPGSSDVETFKDDSDYLRGSLVESFANPLTGAITEADTQLIKFHGAYQQDDRDQRLRRQEKKLEPAYSFMIRMRMPGGELTADQWKKIDEISNTYGNETIKLSSRQAVQFHGIIKFDLKKSIQMMDEALLDSIAGCGDVNRNVMCTPDPSLSKANEEVYAYAKTISEHLMPSSRAYHEIWLDEGKGEGRELVIGGEEEIEPLYGKHYLPRKFKIGIAIPPYNDSDVYINDIGLIAIVENDKLLGFNVAVGGGLGMTFGRDDTMPRLASEIGFCTPDQVLDVCAEIMMIQRDYGNRQDRKLSRFKYTIDKYGLEWFSEELHNRLGYSLDAVRPAVFTTTADQYGWHKDRHGKWHLLLHVEHGRIRDTKQLQQKTALLQIAEKNLCGFRLTANQNMLLHGIKTADKKKIEKILEQNGQYADGRELSGMRRNSIACVSMNTCPLGMAEAERYLPTLITKLEPILEKHGLLQDEIKIRMTGCPNGCGRSVMAEIGLIGKSLGRYNMYLGGDHQGLRLNTLYRENIDEATILELLDGLFEDYAANREASESFGDFAIRQAWVAPTENRIGYFSLAS